MREHERELHPGDHGPGHDRAGADDFGGQSGSNLGMRWDGRRVGGERRSRGGAGQLHNGADVYVRTPVCNISDGRGNTSAHFTHVITVRDTTAPVLTTSAGSLDQTLE